MPSITDELLGKMVSIDNVRKGGGIVGSTIRGGAKICIILAKGTNFTAKNLFKALKQAAFLTTDNIEFSTKNVSIKELHKGGSVKVVSDEMSAEVMHYFDEACKKLKIKYTAMKDVSDKNNPQYMVFFEGKNDQMIFQAIQNAMKKYVEEPAKQKTNKERESILAKLKFFRNRVTARNREQKEKMVNRSDKQR